MLLQELFEDGRSYTTLEKPNVVDHYDEAHVRAREAMKPKHTGFPDEVGGDWSELGEIVV